MNECVVLCVCLTHSRKTDSNTRLALWFFHSSSSSPLRSIERIARQYFGVFDFPWNHAMWMRGNKDRRILQVGFVVAMVVLVGRCRDINNWQPIFDAQEFRRTEIESKIWNILINPKMYVPNHRHANPFPLIVHLTHSILCVPNTTFTPLVARDTQSVNFGAVFMCTQISLKNSSCRDLYI